jgi:hypothetical protein
MGMLVAPDERLVLRARSGAVVRLETWLTDDMVLLRLEAPESRTQRVRMLELHLGPASRRCELDALAWSLCGTQAQDRSAVTDFVSAVHEELAGSDGRDLELAEALVQRGVAAAVRRADPALRALACQFRPDRRYRVYRWMVRDPSRRIAQLAAVCPGALVVALDLAHQVETWPAVDALMQAVVQGKSLGAVLEPVVARGGHVALVRRASARLYAFCLLRMGPGPFVTADIPRQRNANAAWFKLMSSASARMRPFVSCHAAELVAAARQRDWMPYQLVRWLDDCAAATGRRPGRRSRLAALLAQSEAWHEQQPRPDDELSPAQALPAWLPAPRPVTAVAMRSFLTVGDLIAEGREMRHCLASHARLVVRGEAQACGLTIDGQRLTLELRDGRIHDLRGVANRAPSSRERALVATWLAAQLDVGSHIRE